MRIELTLTDGARIVTKVVVQIDATQADFDDVVGTIVTLNNLGLVKADAITKAKADAAWHGLTGE